MRNRPPDEPYRPLHLSPGTTWHSTPAGSTVTRQEELPSAPCFFMVIRKRWVQLIACTEKQGAELLAEGREYMATWTDEGRRNTRMLVHHGKPQLSPRKRYHLTSGRDYFYNWRLRKR